MRASDREGPNHPSILMIGVDARSRLPEGRRSFRSTASASRRTSAAESAGSTRRRPSLCRRRTRPTPSGAHRGSSRGQDHIGAEAATLAEAILAGRPHPEQGYRPCLRPCAAESSIRSGRARGHATSIAGRLRMLTPQVGCAGQPQRAKKNFAGPSRGLGGVPTRSNSYPF